MPVRLAPNEEPLPGYRLIDRLGRGGFGEVWECEAPGGIRKAIKFVNGEIGAEDEDGRPADQELKSLNRVKAIRHPYILSLERYDIVDDQLIIVMELADRNLWDRYKDCRGLGMPGIPRDELLGYLAEAAEALDLMNDRFQIQHLDVKPQNLFLVHNHLKVADFGLAKDLEGGRGTITGGVTPVYAGPETFDGYASRYTDQYSLAIVFQELLTGTRPFPGPTTRELVMQHLREPPVLDALAPADRAVIARALEKRPDDRWPSCTELIRQLRVAGDGSGSKPGTAAAPAPKPPSGPVAPPAGRGSPPARTPLPPPVSAPAARTAPTAPLPPLMVPGSASLSTPRTGLTVPRLVTPQAVGSAPAATQAGGGLTAVPTARMSTLGLAPPERTGDGVLLPAVVVAVGGVGLQVLKAVRRLARDRFGPDPLPHLRFLYIDTDPRSISAATDPSSPDRLEPHEAVLARLHRPAHYLQDGKPNPESWMPPGLLYRLPRESAPADGVRAFGRLALVDNYRAVAQRIRQAVEAFVSDEPIESAAARTGLGVRSNRGRAYLAAGLAGGTGSGMFLDLAYLLKSELRQIGYLRPEVHGLLFTPPTGPSARGPGAGNTYGALAELAHFQSPGTRYTASFGPNEPTLTDADGPFARTAVFSLPTRPSESENTKAAGLAARAVALDLFTPAGRALDAARGPRQPGTVQPLGLYRLSWPRADLLTLAAGRFAKQVVLRWTGREAPHLRDPLTGWLAGEWEKRGLTTQALAGKLDAAVRDHLRGEPEAVFDALVDPLAGRGAGGRWDAEAVVQVLDQLTQFVGKPEVEGGTQGTLKAILQTRQGKLAADADAHLSALTVSLIEHPQYRLPGAEEGLTLAAERLQQAADDLDAVRTDLGREVRDDYARMFPLIGGLSAATGLGAIGARKGAMTTELVELLRAYPRKRLRLLVLEATLSVVRGLLGAVPECRRDVNLCRAKLAELAAGLGGTPPTPVGPGKMLLPQGVNGLEAAADAVLGAVPPDDIVAFDQAAQAAVKTRFRLLTDACLNAAHGPGLAALVGRLAREFVDARLETANPAELFYRYRPDPAAAGRLLFDAFAAAAPAAAPPGADELTLFAAPAGPTGDRLRADAAAASGVPLTPALMTDEIAFVRECPAVPTAALPPLGPPGREAADALLAAGLSPHARTDVPWPAADPRPAEPSRY